MCPWYKTAFLRVISHRLLAAVEPGIDDGRLTEHRQRTRIVSVYFRTMLKLRLIFIEFRNHFVIAPKLPKYWANQSLRGNKYNCSMSDKLLRHQKCPFLLPMMVQYLTVHIGVNLTQYDWAVMHQYLISLPFRAWIMVNHTFNRMQLSTIIVKSHLRLMHLSWSNIWTYFSS